MAFDLILTTRTFCLKSHGTIYKFLQTIKNSSEYEVIYSYKIYIHSYYQQHKSVHETRVGSLIYGCRTVFRQINTGFLFLRTVTPVVRNSLLMLCNCNKVLLISLTIFINVNGYELKGSSATSNN